LAASSPHDGIPTYKGYLHITCVKHVNNSASHKHFPRLAVYPTIFGAINLEIIILEAFSQFLENPFQKFVAESAKYTPRDHPRST
jgi:hypothetical protein